MPKIRAAVLRKKGGPLKIETIEMERPRDNEVLVRLVASGICHTDIDLLDDWDGPAVLGHEGAGIVERAGRGVKGVERGDHVVLSYQSCGLCPQCRAKKPTECGLFYEANFGFARLDGTNALAVSGIRGHFFGQSSFSTLALATKRNIVKVAKDLPLEVLAPLGCSMQTGAATIMNALKVTKGEGVAVFGAGAVGLAAVMAARIAKANPIIGVDINPARLKLALELGATHVIDNRHEDAASRLSTVIGKGVDYALEITGDPGVYRLAVSVLKPRGMLALIASPGGAGRLPGGRKAVGIIQGGAIPQRFIPMLIRHWIKGEFPFDRLIKFYDFRAINRAITDARRGRTIKPVLKIGAD